MEIPRFDLNLLRYVAAIDQTGSISLAAQKLHVTQPAVSNALTKLRELTGDDIFTRSPAGQRPTNFGRTLIGASRTVFTSVNNCLRSRDYFDPETTPQDLSLAIDEGICSALLPKILSRINRFPNISLAVTFPHRGLSSHELEIGDSDLLLGLRRHSSSTVETDVLIQDEIVVAVGHSHPLADRKVLTEKIFDSLQFAIVRTEKADYQTPELALRRLGRRRKIGFVAPQSDLLPAISATTNFATTLPLTLYRPLIDLYGLKTFPIPFEFPPLEVYMQFNKSNLNNPAIRWLRDEIRKTLTAE